MPTRRAVWIGPVLTAGLAVLALQGHGGTDAARAVAAFTESSPPSCAFRNLRPCPAVHGAAITLHGPYVARSTSQDGLRIRFNNFGGGEAGPLLDARSRVGRTVRVRVGPATRIRIVQPDRRASDASRTALRAALANYESAPVYIAGQLVAGAHLDDRLVTMRATRLTLDLSGGARASLNGRWRVEGVEGWTVLLSRAQESPPTWLGDITDESGRATATVVFTQPGTGYVCASLFRADEDTAAGFDCGPIADSARRLGPIPSIERGGKPAVLVRMP